MDDVISILGPDKNEIPVEGISMLKIRNSRYLSIGFSGDYELLKIIRRNPPSKKHPKGSVTVKNKDEKLFRLYE